MPCSHPARTDDGVTAEQYHGQGEWHGTRAVRSVAGGTAHLYKEAPRARKKGFIKTIVTTEFDCK